MQELDFLPAHTLRDMISSRKVSVLEVTRRALERAMDTQASLNAFFDIDVEGALAAARTADDAMARGVARGPLFGLPVSVKDLIAVAGRPYASGSLTAAGNIASMDAPSVERLRRAGAILIGKTTTSEFGCKPVGDSPLTGVTRHPWNPQWTPGGSSAGGAASVAAGITALALGTDGGGSLRIPASLCGLVGFKASFGRVPVWPVSATPTLAHVGPLARNVADAALLSQTISGADRRDPFSINGNVPDLIRALDEGVKGMRIAWSPTLGYARPSADVLDVAITAVRQLEQAGAHVEIVETVFEQDPVGLWMAEFYAGVGTRLRPFLEEQRDKLDPVVAALLESALGQSMQDYYASVFRRYALRESMREFFERYDLLVSPTLPVSSVPAGASIPPGYEDRNALSWVYYTYPFNLTGQPALSLNAGLCGDGMPVGLQIVGKLWAESDVIRAAATVEAGLGLGDFAHKVRI